MAMKVDPGVVDTKICCDKPFWGSEILVHPCNDAAGKVINTL